LSMNIVCFTQPGVYTSQEIRLTSSLCYATSFTLMDERLTLSFMIDSGRVYHYFPGLSIILEVTQQHYTRFADIPPIY